MNSFRLPQKLLFTMFSACSFLVFASQVTYASTIVVGITSVKDVKIVPIVEAFKRAFPYDEIKPLPFKANSQIADEPVSQLWGLQGARNRIESAKRLAVAQGQDVLESIQYWASIENYIEETDAVYTEEEVNLFQVNGAKWIQAGEKKWIDRGAILIENAQDHTTQTQLSEKVYFPAFFADTMRERTLNSEQAKSDADSYLSASGFSVTVGQVIKEFFQTQFNVSLDDGNWHSTFGGKTRDAILENALNQALRKIRSNL